MKCKKNTEKINPRISKVINGKIILLSKCAILGGKKLRFIKEQEVSILLSNLVIKAPFCKIPILGNISF